MVSSILGNGTALPVTGLRSDSVAESLSRRHQHPAGEIFPDGDQAQQPRSAAQAKATTGSGSAAGLPFLRRRTDRGEPADPKIQIPPHLERRRAWRAAFGLNTFHTQELSQRDESLPSRQLRTSAADAYRENAVRGRLDLHLAQLVSLTV